LEKSPIVLPSLTPMDLHREALVHGTIIGVVPHLGAELSTKARNILGAHGRLDLQKPQIPRDLRTILKDDEVVYLVVGKWPPPLPEPVNPTYDTWLKRQSDISRALSEGLPIQLMVGRWPIK